MFLKMHMKICLSMGFVYLMAVNYKEGIKL